nr:cyclic peptide export ABC transporter [uncultured Desulfobacter sp.]
MMKLLRLLVREIPDNFNATLAMNALIPISTLVLVVLISNVSQTTATDGVNPRLMFMFVITVIVFHITHTHTLVTASRDAEQLIHRLRIRLFDLVRQTDLITIEKIGHAKLQGVLTQDTQVLSQVLPVLVIGLQQSLMLVFFAAYLAWLSPLACVLAFSLAGIAVALHFTRVKAMRLLMRQADTSQRTVFKGLSELIKGFKEIRMNGPKAEGVVGHLAGASKDAAENNVQLKQKWGRNYAVTETLLYSLAGLIVFVVPVFAPDFHKVVMPATIVVLFISGPVCTVAFATPMVTQAELALEHIASMEEILAAAAADNAAETREILEERIESIGLRQIIHTYHDDQGDPLFTAGPLDATFQAGRITFITGGNGSGKSTLLRLLTGLIPVDSGQILVNGSPLGIEQRQSYRDKISAVFSDFHLSSRIYAINNQTPGRIDELLRRLEISAKVRVENNTFSTTDLSTGQRKRLALMVAELEDKPVIVLDEWAADQDPHFRRVFYEKLLPDLKDRGKIVICVTHDDRWFHTADRIYHMDEGKMEITGTPFQTEGQNSP